MTHSTVVSPNGIVTVKASNSCGVSAIRVLSVTTTSCIRENQTALNLLAYPNPVKDDVNIQFSSAKENEIATIEVMDNIGRLVYAEQMPTQKGANEKRIDLRNYKSGIYILQVRTNQSIEKVKLLIE